MNKVFLTILSLFFISCTHSQEKYQRLSGKKLSCPMIINNESVIISKSLFDTNRDLILEVSFLKDKPNRKEHKFYNLTENGIIFVKLNKKIPFKTQVDLNKFFELGSTNEIYVNGYLLESKDYKIATESIFEIELVQPNPENGLNKSVLNIWTITKNERKKGCSK